MKRSSNELAPPRAEGVHAVALGLPQIEIEKIAGAVQSALKIDTRKVDLVEVVERLGGKIISANWDEVNNASWASLEVRGPRDWTISLPSFTSPLEDRFAIVHEIGHFVLHSRMGRAPLTVNLNRATRDLPEEVEANWFAAGWLMPRQEFLEQMSETSEDVDLLADYFRVPKRAAERRVLEVKQ